MKHFKMSQNKNLTSKKFKISDFKASHGWFRRFCERNSLVYRRATRTGKGFNKQTPIDVCTYLDNFHNTIIQNKYKQEEITNFDESWFGMESPSNYTYESKGSKKAFTKTTGKEWVKMSVLMAATAKGVKLDPLAIIPRKTQLSNVTIPSNISAVYDSNGNHSIKLCYRDFI